MVQDRLPVLVWYKGERTRLDAYDPFQDVQASAHSDAEVLQELRTECQLLLDSLACDTSTAPFSIGEDSLLLRL